LKRNSTLDNYGHLSSRWRRTLPGRYIPDYDANAVFPYLHSTRLRMRLNPEYQWFVRQNFTKSNSFENITYDEVDAVMDKPNHSPRKIPRFKTPHTVFFAEPLQGLHEDHDGNTELNSPIVYGYYEF